ncbi:GtrA family protein [Bordetella bronchialis]|uniref:GtrA family protein n=1 Tax=Bordetella bronchialis TaxID=463025 RepID=UPI003D0867D1
MSDESRFAVYRKLLPQFLRYALIGVLTNLIGYILYLALTHLWGMPKVTMTMLYSMGVAIGFFANRRFTFRHEGHVAKAGARYLLAQFLGYLANFSILVVFVDWLGFAHQIVQAAAIIMVAILLFFLSRFFVFNERSAGPEQSNHESLS